MLQDECETRAPVHWEWNGYNWFLKMFAPDSEDPGLFDRFLQSLKENSPEVMAGSGFVGVVPFDWGYRGALMSKFDPLLGAWTVEPADPVIGFGRLSPAQLAERVAKIEEYTEALHSLGKVKLAMPYIDFGTQLFGRHNRPLDVPESVWGFWEFYDHWDEYAEPSGPFGLGSKPPDPTTWLAKWHDPNGKQFLGPDPPEIPDELRGLSFSYYPVKPGYGPTYRYAVCVNTLGWAIWWKQILQWAARVGYDGLFIDNSFLTRCWNQECQEGYQEWLQNTFTAEEIRRYFTTTTSNLLIDPSIEGPWLQEVPGQWRTGYWGGYPAQTSPIFPDTDAYGGRYSCRIEGPGDGDVAYFSHATQGKTPPALVPANEDLRLTFYYKTTGLVQVKAVIAIAVAPDLEVVLTLEDNWKQEKIDFHTLPDSSGNVDLYLRFEVTGTGKVWLDEFWLGKVTQPPEFKVELRKPSDDPLQPSDDPVRKWAAERYWLQVSDEKLGYLRDQAREVNPKFSLFTNGFHTVNADYFMSEGRAIDLDSYRYDVGFYPGVYLPHDPPIEIRGRKVAPMLLTQPLVVTNIFDYKYIHSQRVPSFFGHHMPTWDYADEHLSYAHNPDSVLLNMAEAAAFGGGAGPENGLRYAYFVYGKDPALLAPAAAPLREVEKQFWKFIKGHKNRYAGYRTHADVGIVYHDLPYNGPAYEEFHHALDLAKGLASQGVLWDVLTDNRCNSLNFARLRTLIYQDVSRISEAEAQAVLEFIGQGGLVIAAGVVGDYDEWFQMRLPDPTHAWPPVGLPPTDNIGTRARPPAFQQQEGAGGLIYQPAAMSADQVIAATEAHLSRTVQMAGNVSPEVLDRLRLNAWVRKKGGGTITLHVINYNVPLGIDGGDQLQPLSNVQVSVPLPPQMQVQSVRLCSPESNGPPQNIPFNIANALVTFEIPSLRIYAVATIE
jgi:hypothetical protein